MSRRMKTGIAGLDTILDGGFLYHNSILVKGQPGAGKTTMGIQTIYNGVTMFDEPGIIVLFEQFPQQLYRDLDSYSWKVKELIDQKKIAVIFASIQDIATSTQITESPLISQIHTIAAEIGAKRILIDGVSHFLKMLRLDVTEREIFLKFINSIKSIGLTPILTAEAGKSENNPGYEDYLSDCVIVLTSRATIDPTFQIRQVQVKKTRGHSHVRGRHPYYITDKGVEIFPNLPPPPWEVDEDHGGNLERISSSINGLNNMLRGGYTIGTSSVIAGMPGTYKTTMGAQFLKCGADEDRPGLLVTFEEDPQFLIKIMKERGIDLAPHVESGAIKIWHRFPKHFYVEELIIQIEEELKKNNTQLFVLDAMNDLERGIEDPATYKDYFTNIYTMLCRRNVTGLFIQKLDKFTANAPLTNIRYASLFDGVVYTGTIEIESVMHKVISILKMRGSNYLGDLREIVCNENGLSVMDKFVGMSGILTGNAHGQYKKAVEEIIQPLFFIRDFIDIMASPDVENEQRAQVRDSILAEVNKLVDKMCEKYDIKPEDLKK